MFDATREDAETKLKSSEAGEFIIRNSSSKGMFMFVCFLFMFVCL